jgi:hypothetical protein
MAPYCKPIQQPKATIVSKRHYTSPACMYPAADFDLTIIAPPPTIAIIKKVSSSVGVVRLIGSSRFSGVIHSCKKWHPRSQLYWSFKGSLFTPILSQDKSLYFLHPLNIFYLWCLECKDEAFGEFQVGYDRSCFVYGHWWLQNCWKVIHRGWFHLGQCMGSRECIMRQCPEFTVF